MFISSFTDLNRSSRNSASVNLFDGCFSLFIMAKWFSISALLACFGMGPKQHVQRGKKAITSLRINPALPSFRI